MPLWSVNQHLVTLWSVKKAPCGTVVSKPAPCGTVVSYQAPCGTVDSKPEPFGTVDSKPAPCGTVISFPAPCGTVDSKPASCATVISEPAPCGTVVSYPASCGAVVSKQAPRGTVISKPAPRGTVVSKPAPSYVFWNSMSSTLIVFDLQGCFAFKGKKKIASIVFLIISSFLLLNSIARSVFIIFISRKFGESGNLSFVEDYFHGKDDTVTWKNRLEVFQNLWEAIDTEIQILQADLNTKIFDDLLKFASERVSPHIAKLRSKDCNNVKNILTKTLEQFLQKPELFQDEDEASDINKKKLPCTLSTLAAWYKEHYTVSYNSLFTSTEVTKSSLRNNLQQVQIQFLPQLEKQKVTLGTVYIFTSPGEAKSNLRNSILFTKNTCVALNQKLEFMHFQKEGSSPKKKKSLSGKPTDCVKYPPVVIIVSIFKVFDVISAVHRLLPNSVSSILCMEKFQAPPSVEYLTLVINQIVMTPNFPFKLGSKVFQLLLDIFLYHDFSVLNFIKGLHNASFLNDLGCNASYCLTLIIEMI
ncbi:hypothetical protein KUTeg_007901 [Tegillarca granosa]|uniref:Origin recognition complex subunit 3 N-terminal domain-containing protein n=1 Tax=Tegillarca granosa TaxID=220873 RepID=A0ABQ9FGH9_TEGGR|nr:hypothetical protein KUTeg_007901 [Tegillarca granosa]